MIELAHQPPLRMGNDHMGVDRETHKPYNPRIRLLTLSIDARTLGPQIANSASTQCTEMAASAKNKGVNT